MPACKVVAPVHLGVMRRREGGRKVGAQIGPMVFKGGADNLFYSAFMQIYAGAEPHGEGPEKGTAGRWPAAPDETAIIIIF
jgi:hypothetical protein